MTEYQKIYKVMRDNIWTSIEVFNNVHTRLGGLHTIMNSSGSVGNLWWCKQNAIPDLIKHCTTKLLLPLPEVLCQCWQEGAVPQDTRDAKIITIYKTMRAIIYNNNNYRGISLRSIVGKIFARVILIRLQKLAERIHPESQSGFRAERSTIIHDLLPSIVTREVQRTAYALVHLVPIYNIIFYGWCSWGLVCVGRGRLGVYRLAVVPPLWRLGMYDEIYICCMCI